MSAAIKLTNEIRDAFVNACMSEIPKPDYEALQKEAQAIMYKNMSPAVRKVFREDIRALRGEWFRSLGDGSNFWLVTAGLEHRDVLGMY